MLRRILGNDEFESEDRIICASAIVQNKGKVVKITLARRSGRELQTFSVEKVLVWDISLTEILPDGNVELKSILPRFLSVTQQDGELRIIEVEPGQVIPP